MRIFSIFVALLLGMTLGCSKENGRSDSRAPIVQATNGNEAGTQAGGTAAPSLAEMQAELPGFPVQGMPEHLRDELLSAARDEFVYDGNPYTLAGCIKEERGCKAHAVRGLGLIAKALGSGASKAEALSTYNRYYTSFEPKSRKDIDLEGLPCLGPPEAKVTLVAFSDFECPYCAAAAPMFEQQVRQGEGQVRLCFAHFPLPGHTNAMSAAQATVFAQRHGKFWPLHDLVFANQKRLSTQTIKDLVQQVGLDPQALVKAVQSDELAAVVEKQREQGRQLGIMGTPTLYMNGRQYVLPLAPEFLRFSIEDELEWQANGGKWSAQ